MTTQQIAAYSAFLMRVYKGDFSVSDSGEFYKPSLDRSQKVYVLRKIARKNRNGYLRIPFRHAGIRYEVMAHVAYWIYKTGRWPKGKLQVNHKDLDRANNHIDNLELVTQSQNIRHRIKARKKAV